MVNVTIESFIRNIGRCIGLIRNYPKGSVDLFVVFREEHYPGSTFLHEKDAKGNRQDIVCEASGLTHMNWQHCIYFID